MRRCLAVAAGLASLLCLPPAAYGGWAIEVVDGEGDVGQFSSLAFDSAGNPCISYHDESNGWLKLACADASGWAVERVTDEETPVGDFSSLAIGADDSLHIAYRRGVYVLSVLKYARKVAAGWQVETVDAQAQGVGHNASLRLDSLGRPHVSHLKLWGKRTLKHAQWSGSGWTTTTVHNPSGDFFFEDAALALDADSPLIAFQAMGNDAYLGLARRAGRKWKIETIDPEGDGISVAIAVAEDGTRHLVYSTSNWVGDPYDLRYTSWTELDGWSLPTVIDQSDQDVFDSVSLALASGELHLSYYDSAAGVLKYARAVAGAWSTPQVVDASGNVGLDSSIAVASGTPRISYYDASRGDLRYAVFTESCTSDADCEDQNDCTIDTCIALECDNTPRADDTACSLGAELGICCGGGCVGALCVDSPDCHEVGGDSCYDGGTCAATCTVECVSGDGYCPPGCATDSDCPDCGGFFDRKSCKAEPTCRWDNPSKRCLPA